MKIINVEVFNFKELSEEAQKHAIKNEQNSEYTAEEFDIWILDDWAKKLEGLGYNEAKILYSGFGSQGDGACFTCSVDIEKIAKRLKFSLEEIKLLEEAEAGGVIEHHYRYYFSRSTTVEVQGNGLNDKVVEKLESAIEQDREELGDKIYKDLYTAYYNALSDETIRENLETDDGANDYTEKGNIFINPSEK